LGKIKKDIKAIFLIDEDKDRVRNIIFTRGLWDEPNKYPDSVKEKEVEWVFAFNSYIKEEAKKPRRHLDEKTEEMIHSVKVLNEALVHDFHTDDIANLKSRTGRIEKHLGLIPVA